GRPAGERAEAEFGAGPALSEAALTSRESSHRLWTVRRHGDAGILRAREAKPLVHPPICGNLRPGIDLRISPWRLAVPNRGGDLIGSGCAPVVAHAVGEVWP